MIQATEGGHAAADETTSLLSPLTRPHDEPLNASESRTATRCSWPWVYIVALCVAIAVTADIGDYLFLAPKVRLFESVACTDYYRREDPSLVGRDDSVPEYLCKVDLVQDKVAMVLGWQYFFDSIPAILLPVPYGYLADTYGRKWIVVAAIMGYLFSSMSILFIVR